MVVDDPVAKLIFIVGGLLILFWGWFLVLIRSDDAMNERTAAVDKIPETTRFKRRTTGLFICAVGVFGILVGVGVV